MFNNLLSGGKSQFVVLVNFCSVNTLLELISRYSCDIAGCEIGKRCSELVPTGL